MRTPGWARVAIVSQLAALAVLGACNEKPGTSPSAAVDDSGADAGLPPLESSPPEPIANDAVRDDTSTTVVFDRLRGGVWTANGDVGTLSYADIDAGEQKVLHEVPIGTDVTSVALSPDLAWVAAVDRGGGAVGLVDATTAVLRRTIAVGGHPRAAVWDARDPRWLYVSLEDDGAVAVVDRTLGVLNHVVPVGRLPAALAVSRLRNELAVARRIDGSITILPLEGVYSPADQGVATIDVPLALQPAQSDDTQPNGVPFALESLAWAVDGDVAWVPHELLANHHPIQFQRNLFPAVSVVNLAERSEVVTNPCDPLGVIAGRKLLFGAINIPDAVGNTSVVSQPCAAVMHPNGEAAYVLACASEDLLTFDLTQGIAVDLLRNLPGDHPSGITLDDTGARAFVVSDQSHSLLTLDTAGGSVIGHVSVIAGPLTLVASDPVDPTLRAGRKLFFEANSSKNPLPTTGNDWMSCGGCHLDGFVSTNELFFDALHPVDQTVDAQIGHIGLADMFSTAPTPDSPTFNPHDVLVALLDQGGLAPDRTGADRTGAVEPANPSSAAATMAQQIAHVIAGDLPSGPSWLLSDGSPPNPTYDADAAWCGQCHAPEYVQWQKSAHAHSALDPMVKYGVGVEQSIRGTQYSRQCAGCHDPVSLRLGDSSFASGRGITCITCHDTERLIRAGGNSDLEMATYDFAAPHAVRAAAQLATIRTPDFCAGCHQQFVPGTGIVAINTSGEFQSSTFATGATQTTCVDCHMPGDGAGHTDHSAPGGNVYIAEQLSDSAFAAEVTAKLSSAIALRASSGVDGVHVVVENVGAGHSFPTGVTDIREPWAEVQALDTAGNVVEVYGGPDSTGLIPANAARFGMDIATADGTVLYRHELTDATCIPFERVVPAMSSVEVVVPVPPALPQGASQFEAVLYYRNVRTTYYRDATGDPQGAAPTVEVARVPVQP
jgi:DNA-binding beta-propeller fold protein YncE